MDKVYLSLGSNLGNREENLRNALNMLAGEPVRITARSAIYETEPQDVREQPWFLNMVVACETSLSPLQLLGVLQRIERELGRVRAADAIPKGPRIIDLDILLFGEEAIDTPELTIPHPGMTRRRFVLEPLLEIAPDLPFIQELAALGEQRMRRL